MKKIVFILIFTVFTSIGFSQSNVMTKKYVDEVTERIADTSFQISTSVFRNNYAFQIWTNHDSSVITGTPSIVLEVSPDGVDWLPYADMDSITISDTVGSYAFEDIYLPSNYMRLRYNLTTNDTIRKINVWYTLKRP